MMIDHKTNRRPKRLVVIAVSVVVIVAAAVVSLTAFSTHASAARHNPQTAPSPAPAATITSASVEVPANPDPAAPGVTVNSGQNESDPFLYLDSGRYYLYTSGIPSDPAVNVPVASTKSFATWSKVTDALPTLPPWAGAGFTWAPDIHRFGSTYVLYFTASLKKTGEECIGSSVSSSPTGPFTPESRPFICQRSLGGSIDPRVFTDTDGTDWMLWKSDENVNGSPVPTKLWSQKLTADGLGLLGSPSELMGPDEPWQGTIVEAPDMLKINGVYWVFYTGNWFNQPDYGVGAARCAGPTGPCLDTTDTPLLASNLQGQGPGEASVFADSAGVWMLYTPYYASSVFSPRPVDITHLGFNIVGPYLAAGGAPPDLSSAGQPTRSGS